MANPIIGQAGILVRPITDKFAPELQRQVERANQTVQVPIRAITDEAMSGIQAVQDFGRQSVTGQYNLDTRQAEASIDGMISKGGRLASVLQGQLATAAAAFGAATTSALYKGYQRFTTIEDSTKAMTVVLGDAAKAGTLLNDILEVVTGTPYNLDQFAQAGKNLVAFGAPAEKVPGYLRAIGEAAAASGGSAEAVGSVVNAFGDAVAMGRLTGDTLTSLAVQGVPALQILANQYGVTTEELRKMVSEGQIPAIEGFDKLSEGIMKGTTGAAGNTNAFAGTMEQLRTSLSGAVGGMGAAVARFGASIIKGFGPIPIAALNAFSNVLDGLRPKIEEIMGRLSNSEGLKSFLAGLTDLKDKMPGIIDNVLQFKEAILPLLAYLGATGADSLRNFLGPLGMLVPTINPVLAAILGLAATSPELRAALVDLAKAVTEAVAPLVPIIAEVATAIGKLGADTIRAAVGPIMAFVKAISMVVNVLGKVLPFADSLQAMQGVILLIINLKLAKWISNVVLAMKAHFRATLNNIQAFKLEANASESLTERLARQAGTSAMLAKANDALAASLQRVAAAQAQVNATGGGGVVGGGVPLPLPGDQTSSYKGQLPPAYNGPIPEWGANSKYGSAAEAAAASAQKSAGIFKNAMTKVGGAISSGIESIGGFVDALGGPFVVGLMAATAAIEYHWGQWTKLKGEAEQIGVENINAQIDPDNVNKGSIGSINRLRRRTLKSQAEAPGYQSTAGLTDLVIDQIPGSSLIPKRARDVVRAGVGFVGSKADQAAIKKAAAERKKAIQDQNNDMTGLANVAKRLDAVTMKSLGVSRITDPAKIRKNAEEWKKQGYSAYTANQLAQFSGKDLGKVLQALGGDYSVLGGKSGVWREKLKEQKEAAHEAMVATNGMSKELIDLKDRYDAAAQAAQNMVSLINLQRDSVLESAQTALEVNTLIDTFVATDEDGKMNLDQLQGMATAVSGSIADAAKNAQILAENEARASGKMSDQQIEQAGIVAAKRAAVGQAELWYQKLVDSFQAMNMTRAEAERLAGVITNVAGFKKTTIILDMSQARAALIELTARARVLDALLGGGRGSAALAPQIGAASAALGAATIQGVRSAVDYVKSQAAQQQVISDAAATSRSDAARERADAAKSASDRAAGDAEDAAKKREEDLKRFFQMVLDNLKAATSELVGSLKTLSQNVQARGKELAGSILERIQPKPGLSVSRLLRNANARSGAMVEYQQGIAALQQKGFTTDTFKALGIDGPDSVRQIRRLLSASPAELEQLRSSVQGLYENSQRAAYQEQAEIIGKEVYRALTDFWSKTGTPAGNTIEVMNQIAGFTGDPEEIANRIAEKLGGMIGRR